MSDPKDKIQELRACEEAGGQQTCQHEPVFTGWLIPPNPQSPEATGVCSYWCRRCGATQYGDKNGPGSAWVKPRPRVGPVCKAVTGDPDALLDRIGGDQ